MAKSGVSGPLYVGGVPVIPGFLPGVPTVGGATIFVDSVNGANGQSGAQNAPVGTIAQALAMTVSGRGDFVVIMPGTYAENVVITQDYVTLIGGMPGGYARPDIVPASGIPVTVTAQGVVLQRLRMAGTAADCCLQQGNGFVHYDCVFDGDGTANKAGLRLVGVSTDDSFTASEGIVRANRFRGCAYGVIFDTAAAPSGVGSTDNILDYNQFEQNTIDLATADSGGAGTTYSVKTTQIGPGNQFLDKNKTCYIDFTTANGGAASDQNGLITSNVFAADAINTTRVKMVGTGFVFANNSDSVGVVDGSALD